MEPDRITGALTGFGIVCTAVWALTEIIPRAFPRWQVPKDRLALMLGPALGVLATLTGLVTFDVGPPTLAISPLLLLARKLLASAVVGLIATVLTGVAHDKLVKPAVPTKNGAADPPPESGG